MTLVVIATDANLSKAEAKLRAPVSVLHEERGPRTPRGRELRRLG